MEAVTESPSADDARATAQRLVENGVGATIAVVQRPSPAGGPTDRGEQAPGDDSVNEPSLDRPHGETTTTVHVVSCLAVDAPRARLLLGLSEPDELRAAATRAEVDGEDYEVPKQKAPVKTMVLLGLGLSVVVVVAAFAISYYLASR
jgi:hypothetical protein